MNGKELGFYANLDSTIIDEPVYGQLILINCTNVTVRDQIISNTTTGLFLYSCTSSVIINNTCNNNWLGIFLEYSNSSTVVNNTCSNNWFGITLYASDSSTVANNKCKNHWNGITLYASDSSTVANNTCTNSWYGIRLGDSNSLTVTYNTCNNNSDGIYFDSTVSSIVANNTCNNNFWGIYLLLSDFCVVTYNLLQENEKYGVYLIYDSDNNIIHHNTFVDNNLGGTSQALDNCTNNFWYNPEVKEGNYWSDWSGRGDYSIDGSAGSEDRYPLDEPAEYSVVYTTDENQLNFIFTLLMLVIPLILTRIISKKVKK